MPFTFSHPAIVLPLAKINQKYISTTALVAGSMAPDFEYFVNMRMMQVHGHTIPGMFYYDLPMAIIMCFLFHYAVRDAIIKYSPITLKRELNEYYGYNWMDRFKSHWHVVILSAIIGIASHLFWDSFTHEGRYFVDLIPFLQESTSFGGATLKNSHIAQLLSSLVGAILVLICSCAPSLDSIRKQKFIYIGIYWGLVSIIAIVILLLRGNLNISNFIATSIAGGLIGMMLAPLIMKWLKIERKVFHKESN